MSWDRAPRYRGQVLAIDRANRVLTALIDGITVPDVRYSSWPVEREPWPLCDAWFVEDGGWRCVRPIGDRQVIFHDDFTRVSSPNGDTPWTLSGGTFVAATGLGLGVGVLRNDVAADGVLQKDSQAFAAVTDQMLHFSARIQVDSTSSQFAGVGFRDSGGDFQGAAAIRTVGRLWDVGGSIAEGFVVVADTWFTVDYMHAVDQFSGAWFDGGLPVFTTPTTVTSFTPSLFINDDNIPQAAQYRLRCDYFMVAACTLPSFDPVSL